MTRADVVVRLKALEAELRAVGVVFLYLYGSHARDEARADSDIDILADFAPGHEPDLSRFMGALHRLEDAFPGIAIGFSTRAGLVPVYMPSIGPAPFACSDGVVGQGSSRSASAHAGRYR